VRRWRLPGVAGRRCGDRGLRIEAEVVLVHHPVHVFQARLVGDPQALVVVLQGGGGNHRVLAKAVRQRGQGVLCGSAAVKQPGQLVRAGLANGELGFRLLEIARRSIPAGPSPAAILR